MFFAFAYVALAMQQTPVSFMTFDRTPSFAPATTVEVGRLHNGGESDYWFRRTENVDANEVVSWTDTRRCPNARSVLLAVEQLELPATMVPFLNSDHILVSADGVGYHLQAYSQYAGHSMGSVDVTSNAETPLAEWVEESLQTLEPCWSNDSPRAN